MTPLISICIPNFNYGRYLFECIESVVSVAGEDIEIIISDNNSTDNSWDIICSFSRQDKRIRAFKQVENIGLYANWNFLLDQARGKYIKILQSDDKLLSSFSEFLRNFRSSLSNEEFSIVLLNEKLGTDGQQFQKFRSEFSMPVVRRVAARSQPTQNMFLRSLLGDDRFQVKSMRGDLILTVSLLRNSNGKVILNYLVPTVSCRVHESNDRKRYVSFEGIVDEMYLCDYCRLHIKGFWSPFLAHIWKSSILTYCILRMAANFLGVISKKDVLNLKLTIKKNWSYFPYFIFAPITLFYKIRV